MKYYERGVRELCHAVKENDPQAIKKMAEYFAELEVLSSCSVIIPAPGHGGSALYTKTIADLVSKMTGAKVLDILKCCPHEPLYTQKKRGIADTPLMYLTGLIPDQGSLYFLDNVYDTGLTYKTADKLFNNRLIPLVYATTH